MRWITGANRHDSVVFEELVDARQRWVASAAGRAGGSGKLHADKGYDFARCRAHLKRRGIKDRIARRGVERNDRLVRHRWVVELWWSNLKRHKDRFVKLGDALLRNKKDAMANHGVPCRAAVQQGQKLCFIPTLTPVARALLAAPWKPPCQRV